MDRNTMGGVVRELGQLWPGSITSPADITELPAWSTVFTRSGLMFCPLGRYEDRLVGIGAYIQDNGAPHHWGHFYEFLNDRWQKILALPTADYALATDSRGALIDRLGRLASVSAQDVAAAISARTPQVLHCMKPDLLRVSDALALPLSTLGVYGSVLYKPPERRSDFDFVVYGATYARQAHQRVLRYRANSQAYKCGSKIYHLRFQMPGSDMWYDPRYWRPEPFTSALASGQYTVIGTESVDKAEVIEDHDGIFTPSIYGLQDGTKLLSYRLGHAAYLQIGDKISLPEIPMLNLCGAVYRVVLGYENLSKG